MAKTVQWWMALHCREKLSQAQMFLSDVSYVFLFAGAGHFPSGQVREDKSSKKQSQWSWKIKTWLPGSLSLSCAHSFPFTVSTHQSLVFSPISFQMLYMSASLCILQVHCSSSPLFFHTLLIICRALLLSLWDQSSAAPLGRVKSLEAGRWASASHSCVTSATSQPSTTGHDALQPSDLWARCMVTSAMSPTLTSRLSHIAPKYRAASPNLLRFFDLCHSYCLCSKWTFMPCFWKYPQKRRDCCS